jgi:hypothetical protein
MLLTGCFGSLKTVTNGDFSSQNIRYTYTWQIGQWGACSAIQCGTQGTQSRSVICVRDQDGATVDDSLCPSPKPSISQVCSAPACDNNPPPPQACALPWGGTIPSGQSVTAYQAPTVQSPNTCQSQTRTCNNGTLSGSYQYQSCTVQTGGGSGSLSFQQGAYLNADSGGAYFSIQLADLTSDGSLDIIALEHNSSGGSNYFWKGDGQGNFSHLDNNTYGTGTGNNNDARGSLWSWVIDFDGDGKLDWFWDDVSPASLRVNTGSGHFTEYCPIENVYNNVRVRGFWDYNHDGILDMAYSDGRIIDGRAVLNGAVDQNTIPSQYVLGNVHCTPMEFYEVPHCAADYGVAEGNDIIRQQALVRADFDGDGQKDVMVVIGARFSGDNEIRSYQNVNGNLVQRGTLSGVRMTTQDIDYSNIVAADFNNDGKIDVAIAGLQGGQTYKIFLNQGNFTFSSGYGFNDSNANGKAGIAAGDFDGDGKVDIAVLSGQGVRVYKNTSH